MTKTFFAAALFVMSFLNVAVCAQPVPALELRRQMAELSESIRSYTSAVEKNTAAAGLVSRVAREIDDHRSAISLDRAMELLEEAREAATAPNGQPTFATQPVERAIGLVQTMKVNYDPARFPELVEKIHHESVHPLQAGAVSELAAVNDVIREFAALGMRLNTLQTAVAARTAAGARQNER